MISLARANSREGIWTRARAATLELSFMAIYFGLYYVTRGLAAGRAYDAFQNAFFVMHVEQALGIALERAVQSVVLVSPPLMALFNGVYAFAHLWTVLVFGLWVFFRDPERYREVRATFLAILVAGLVGYTLFPVAPPRFFPWRGFVDTLAISRGVNYDHPGVAMLYNPFAAMPSLHVAFATFVCIGLFRVSGNRWLRAAGVVYAGLMTLAVIGTGNHFVLDCLAGGLLAVVAWSVVPRFVTRAAGSTLLLAPARSILRQR